MKVNPKDSSDETAAVVFPIDIGIGGQMGVVVADRAVDFAEKLGLEVLIWQAVNDVGDFFAEVVGGGLAWVRLIHGHCGEVFAMPVSFSRISAKVWAAITMSRASCSMRAWERLLMFFAGAGEVDELAAATSALF